MLWVIGSQPYDSCVKIKFVKDIISEPDESALMMSLSISASTG